MVTAAAGAPLAVVHVDLDGARHIFRAHGWTYDRHDDPLFESGLRGALDVFAGAGIKATLFVIAEDAADARKAALIREAVKAGHELASHSVTHRRLTALDRAGKRREIVDSRAVLSDTFGVNVQGFRAPGFFCDPECLELIGEAGYAYDSSELAGRAQRPRAPYRPLAGQALLELPLPALAPLGWPFHPSYSLVAGSWYFNLGVAEHRRQSRPFVLLFHLTDLAEALDGSRLHGWSQRIFTLSYRSADKKRARCRAMLDAVRRHFTMATTAELVQAAGKIASTPAAR